MSRAIQRLNWTQKKKTRRASEQKEEERAAWREQAQTLDARKLVFLDECGSNIALTRLYARSSKGKRACGAIPRNRRANITLLASLSLQGMGEAFIRCRGLRMVKPLKLHCFTKDGTHWYHF